MVPRFRDHLERDFETRACLWAQRHGFYVRKLRFDSYRGATDRLFISPNGDILFAEFKRPGKDLSSGQVDFRTILLTRGLKHYVFRSYEETIHTLQKFLEPS